MPYKFKPNVSRKKFIHGALKIYSILLVNSFPPLCTYSIRVKYMTGVAANLYECFSGLLQWKRTCARHFLGGKERWDT